MLTSKIQAEHGDVSGYVAEKEGAVLATAKAPSSGCAYVRMEQCCLQQADAALHCHILNKCAYAVATYVDG
jgi:hypothetical protein